MVGLYSLIREDPVDGDKRQLRHHNRKGEHEQRTLVIIGAHNDVHLQMRECEWVSDWVCEGALGTIMLAHALE